MVKTLNIIKDNKLIYEALTEDMVKFFQNEVKKGLQDFHLTVSNNITEDEKLMAIEEVIEKWDIDDKEARIIVSL